MIKIFEYKFLYILFFLMDVEAGCIKYDIESKQIEKETIGYDLILSTTQTLRLTTAVDPIIPDTTVGHLFLPGMIFIVYLNC
jgi:hypothetical protein